jgi:MFS family permease
LVGTVLTIEANCDLTIARFSWKGCSMKADAGSGFNYGYIVVVAVFIAMVVIWAAYYAFGVFFKPLLQEFGWTRAMTSGAFSLSSIMMGVMGIVSGGMNDRFGPRLVMSFCGLLLGVGYLLMTQLNTLWQLYLFYGVILGIGMGGGFVPLMTTVARWFDKRRGLMTGIVAAGVGIGAMLGPPLANWLIAIYGWRRAYLLTGLVVMVLIILTAQLLKRDQSQVSLATAALDRQSPSDSAPAGYMLKEAIRTHQFWLFFGLLFCFGFCLFSVMVHITPHVIELGFSPTRAANVLAAAGGISIIGKLLAGRAVDIIGSRKIFIAAFVLMALSFLWLVLAKNIWMFYGFTLFFGLAYGGGISAESPLVAALFGMRTHGLILGMMSLAFSLGGAVGPWLTGYIFDVAASYRLAFLGGAVLSLIALVSVVLIKPVTGVAQQKKFL